MDDSSPDVGYLGGFRMESLPQIDRMDYKDAVEQRYQRGARLEARDFRRRVRYDAAVKSIGFYHSRKPDMFQDRQLQYSSDPHSDGYMALAKPLHPLAFRPKSRSKLSRKVNGNVDDESHETLARSEVPMPSDRHRTVRRPSLEREDAFCDANTFKIANADLRGDAQVAELYRMGLLYDEEDKAETLNLNSIKHEAPVYSVRHAKRARRSSRAHGHGASGPLPLDISFSDLGEDDAIARYLSASSATTPSEIAAAHEQAIQHASRRSSTGRSRSPPLRVIYELDTLRPSFDVETSQPPELVDDFLSDYDCFTDSDLNDSPSQREVHDGAADAWIMLE